MQNKVMLAFSVNSSVICLKDAEYAIPSSWLSECNSEFAMHNPWHQMKDLLCLHL